MTMRALREAHLHVLLLAALFALILPIAIAAVVSTKQTGILVEVGDFTPGGFAYRNYRIVLFELGFAGFLFNSFVMSIIIVVGKLVLSLLAGVAIVYYRVPYRDFIFLFILLTLMLPVPVRFVPLYELMVVLDWTDTLLAITIPYLASGTAVFILRQHFLSIPASLVETARIDGVGPFRFLVSVLIPMSRGVLVGVTVIMFVYAWNQYLWPAVIIDSEHKQVAQVGLSALGGDPTTMAGAILTLLPPLAVLLVFRRSLVQTVTTESVK